MKKLLIIALLLAPLATLGAGLTVPQGGTGTTTVPNNWVLLGDTALRLKAMATSTLGLPTFSDLSSYITAESDPIYSVSSTSIMRAGTTSDTLSEGLVNKFYLQSRVWSDIWASSTLATTLNNAVTAFGWGNHASAGYLTNLLGGLNAILGTATTTRLISGTGSVSAPSIAVGTSATNGMYLNGTSLSFASGGAGFTWDGSNLYPNTTAIRSLGKANNTWGNLYVVNSTTTNATTTSWLYTNKFRAGSEAHFEDFLELHGTSTPATPEANHLRLFSAVTQGHTRPVIMDDDGVEFVINRDNVFIARNTSGLTITKGQAVYITGSTGNVPNIGLAKADSLTTLPAVGLAVTDITNNSFGNVMILGNLSMFNTSAFSTGDRLYVSPTTAGALTNTRPVSPFFAQRMGSVLVSGIGNGSMNVTTAPFIGGEETGTTGNFTVAGNLYGQIGDSSNRSDIYANVLRTNWLEVSQNVIDSSLKIGSSTNDLSADLVFENTGGSGTLSLGTNNRFTLDKGLTVPSGTTTGNQVVGTINGGTIAGNNSGDEVGAGILGQIPYYSGTGHALIATSTLFVKDGKVGIGTTSPGDLLQISGNGQYFRASAASESSIYYARFGQAYDVNNSLRIYQNTNQVLGANYLGTSIFLAPTAGNVGIGTTSPVAKFAVRTSGTGGLVVSDTTFGGNYAALNLTGKVPTATNYNFLSAPGDNLYINRDSGSILFRYQNATQMTLDSSGRLGVGTSTLSNRLEVAGNTFLGGNLTATGTLAVTGASTATSTINTNLTFPAGQKMCFGAAADGTCMYYDTSLNKFIIEPWL